jgi:caffeoyl-CoA O-methyltransferase
VTEIVPARIEEYALAHSSPPADYLRAVEEATRAETTAAGMMVGPLEGRFLEMLVHALGARRVLEVGTFTGYSSLSMAAGLAPGGRIVTLEVDPRHAALARRNIAASPYAEAIEVVEGPALDALDALEGPFDFVFLDADKGGYVAYYEATLPMLAPRGLLAADNTLWSGRVLDERDEDEDTLAIRRFNDHVAADPRVVCVQLPIRDGVTLVRRRP